MEDPRPGAERSQSPAPSEANSRRRPNPGVRFSYATVRPGTGGLGCGRGVGGEGSGSGGAGTGASPTLLEGVKRAGFEHGIDETADSTPACPVRCALTAMLLPSDAAAR